MGKQKFSLFTMIVKLMLWLAMAVGFIVGGIEFFKELFLNLK